MDITHIMLFINLGVLGVMTILWITGIIVPKTVIDEKNETIAELKQSVKLERQRADSAIESASLNLRLFEAFKQGLSNRPGEPDNVSSQKKN